MTRAPLDLFAFMFSAADLVMLLYLGWLRMGGATVSALLDGVEWV